MQVNNARYLFNHFPWDTFFNDADRIMNHLQRISDKNLSTIPDKTSEIALLAKSVASFLGTIATHVTG